MAEDAERAILCGWWRRLVPDLAGDGRRKRASGRVLRGHLHGIGCVASGMGRGLAFGGSGRRLWLPALGPGAVDLWPGLLAVASCGRGCRVMGAGPVGGMKNPALRRGVGGGVKRSGAPSGTRCGLSRPPGPLADHTGSGLRW